MNTQITKTSTTGRKRYSASERRKLVCKYHKSGVSQAAFCRANGLTDATLSRWLLARGRKSLGRNPVTFAEVEMPALRDSGMTVELVYPDGRVLRLQNCAASDEGAAFIRRVISC